jgi:hypothetical protein
MRNKTTLVNSFLTVVMLAGLFLAAEVAASPSDLAKGFAAPPQSARPWVYWFWLDGNVTREGITADLEAMRRSADHGGGPGRAEGSRAICQSAVARAL